MTFDIIIAAMAAKHGINPEWGGCRPGILGTVQHDYEFLVGQSVAKFSTKEVDEAVAEWNASAFALHAKVFNECFQAEPEPEPVVFTAPAEAPAAEPVAEPEPVAPVEAPEPETPKKKVRK